MDGKSSPFKRKGFTGTVIEEQRVSDVLRIAKAIGVQVARASGGGIYCDDMNGTRHFCAPGQQAPTIRQVQPRR